MKKHWPNSVEGCSHPPPFFSPTDPIFNDFSECSNCVLPFSTFYFVTLRKWWQLPYWLIYEIFLHYRAAFKCQVCPPPICSPQWDLSWPANCTDLIDEGFQFLSLKWNHLKIQVCWQWIRLHNTLHDRDPVSIKRFVWVGFFFSNVYCAIISAFSVIHSVWFYW